MRLKLIACEVLYREMCAAVARSAEVVDVEFLPKGLHDMGGKAMTAKLQECVDRVPAELRRHHSWLRALRQRTARNRGASYGDCGAAHARLHRFAHGKPATL